MAAPGRDRSPDLAEPSAGAEGEHGMRVGVQVPEVERFVPWSEYAHIAHAAERGGLDSLWVGDHLLYDLPDGTTRGPWECWTLLAGLAAVTQRVTLAPLVASTSFHAPAMLAKLASTVDAISGGRLVLGLGAGWNEREYQAYGFPFDRRVSRFEEAFMIIHTLVREGRIDFEGEFYRLQNMVLDPPARADMPILVGSTGPRMLAITAPFMDMWNTWYADFNNDPARLGERLALVDEAAIAAGRDPAEIERTAALLLQLGDAPTRRNSQNPITDLDRLPAALDALAEAGISHAQLVLDPITAETVATAAQLVEAWRSG